MTWTEAIAKGRSRWAGWVVTCSAFGGLFLIKGGSGLEFLYAMMIGAAVGTALGFGLGPAAEKSNVLVSGFFAGAPFYLLGISILVLELQDALKSPRSVQRDGMIVVAIFLSVGCLFSLGQGYRVRKQARTSARSTIGK